MSNPFRLLNNILILLGAVICGRRFLNPVKLARKIMDDSPHCALSGDGALEFATNKNFPTCEPDELISQKAKEELDVSYDNYLEYVKYNKEAKPVEESQDTQAAVSAIALDVKGHLACAISTGTSKFSKANK